MTGTALVPFDETVSHRRPMVFEKDGEVFADSRDVAAFFEKAHRHVLRDIDHLLQIEPELKLRDFSETSYQTEPKIGLSNENNGLGHINYRCFHLTRDGFALLAMGFTGSRALTFKRKYIAAFNTMESTLRDAAPPAPAINVRDPKQLLQIAMQLVEVNAELSAKVETQQAQIATAAPKVEFFDAYADSSGNHTLSNAARILGIPVHKFCRDLRREYIFKQGGALVPYSRWLTHGYFVVKALTYGGTARHQTFITPRGLQHFSKRFDAKPSLEVLSSTGLFEVVQAGKAVA